MGGFTGLDNRLNSMSALGKRFQTVMAKQFNPTAVAVANEWHTYFRGGGYPSADAIFDTGTNLLFQSLTDQEASAGCLYHGGDVGAAGDWAAYQEALEAAEKVVDAKSEALDGVVESKKGVK